MQIEVIIEKKLHKLNAEEGKTILETLQEHGIHVLTAPCGGRGRCGKCTVEVEHMGEVLACMTKVTDGMRITIPKVQLRAQKSKIAENGTVTHYPADDGEGLDAACDIGTTTVVCHLIDGKTGEKLATVSEPSAQRSFGADVLSRIQAAEAGKLEILKEQIIFQIAQMLRTLQKKTGRGEQIHRLAVVGNTVMCHLFAGISPVSIGVTPFMPQEFFGKEYTGEQLGLTDCRSVYIAPAVAGFVGGDITSDLLAVMQKKPKEKVLLLDIGTNGEMAVGNEDQIYCCATAVGSAFEGAEMAMGMPAAAGTVVMNNQIMDTVYFGMGHDNGTDFPDKCLVRSFSEKRIHGVFDRFYSGIEDENGYQQTAKSIDIDGCQAHNNHGCQNHRGGNGVGKRIHGGRLHGIRIEFFPNIMVVTVHVDFYQNGAYQNSHGKQTCVYGFRMQNFGKGSF